MAYRSFSDIPLVSTVAYRPLGDLPEVPITLYERAIDAQIPEVSTVTYEAVGDPDIPTPVLWVGGAVVVGLITWGMYSQYQISKAVAEKEGSSGLLKLYAGQAAIGVGTAAADRMLRRNKRRRRGLKRNATGGWTLEVGGSRPRHFSTADAARKAFKARVYLEDLMHHHMNRRDVRLLTPSGKVEFRYDPGRDLVLTAEGMQVDARFFALRERPKSRRSRRR